MTGKSALTILVLGIYAAGCSTVAGRQNNEQMVLFDANVEEVLVSCSGKTTTTPGSLSLKQSKSHSCSAEKEGFEKKSFRVRTGISKMGFKDSTRTNTDAWGKWTLGIGTLLGWIVDLPSGAMRNFTSDDYLLEMKADGTTSATKKVLGTAAQVGGAILQAPKEVVDGGASSMLDATVHRSAEKMGVQVVQEEVKYPSKGEPTKI